MRTLLLVVYLCTVALVTCAQLSHTDIVIPTESGRSVFPLIHSKAQPKMAATINKVLQIEAFNHINVEKNPADYADNDRYSDWSYSVDYSNKRLLRVVTNHFFPQQSMHTPEHTETADFFFDTTTGDRIYPINFLTEEGIAKLKVLQKEKINILVKRRHDELEKKYTGEEYKDALPSEESTIAHAKSSIDSYTIPIVNDGFNSADKSFTFYYSWEEGDNEKIPELNNGIQITLKGDELKLFISDAWLYYIMQTSIDVPTPDPITHVWSGMIGGKIPVTLMVTRDGDTISGKEVYDRFGGVIELSGKWKGKSILLNELDDKGNKVAYFEVESSNGKLIGTWKKADGSKAMDFKATIGGTELSQ